MVKKARARRSVDQQGVKKKKNSSKLNKKNIFDRMQKLIPKKYVAFLHKFSEFVFKGLIYICCKLSFIRATVDNQGKLTVRKTKWELVGHYAVLIVQLGRMLHNIFIVTSRVSNGLLDVTTFLLISSLLVYVAGFSMSLSMLFRPYETVQLLNTSPLILCLFLKNGKDVTMFQIPKNAIIITTQAVLCSGCVALVSAFGFAVHEYPVSMYYIAESIIIGRPKFIPYLLWKILFWPVEFFSYVHMCMLGTLSSMVLLTLPSIGLACTNEIRKIHVNTADSWMKLRRKYYLLQVYLCLINSWIKFMIVPAIIAICSAIVDGLYMSLRHSEIAILIYLAFVGVTVCLFILLFWFSFEVIAFIRTTEAIVATLNTRDKAYFFKLSSIEQRLLTKCGKATRQAVFQIGDFVEYSIDCPIGYWDEILNQLIFLLTL